MLVNLILKHRKKIIDLSNYLSNHEKNLTKRQKQIHYLFYVDTNHGVGGSNPSSPTTGQKGKYISLWG
ncbi:hypothetical protein PHJA_000056100 [Phtheirospermum japonicum]|uniref:Uncharacterized protein n=1 Tax=Phtheirospermum japonicum TaxID=374723 RepID=A0A830AYD1_9LAMI|nr:hypothetical protein PHJA_000056100 [Phtheirospermum japonicum]